MKEKKNKKRLPWWAVTLIVLLSAIVIFAAVSLITIRAFVGDSLSLQGTLAMASYGGFELPGWYKNLVLNVDRTYPGLPQLSADPADRTDMLELYETCMYGKTPTDGFSTSFELLSLEKVFGGKAEKQTVSISVSNEKGTFSADMIVLLPEGVETIPVFIGENFSGNDEAFESSEWPFEELLNNGFGVATLCYKDWAQDETASYRDGVLQLFEDDTLSAYSAWAFAISRGIDYLETLPAEGEDPVFEDFLRFLREDVRPRILKDTPAKGRSRKGAAAGESSALKSSMLQVSLERARSTSLAV